MYLERIRELCKDTSDPTSRYSMNEGLLIITTGVEGLANKILVTTVGSYVRQVPFLFIAFRDTVIQYLQHDPTHQNVTLNVIDVNC